MKIEKNERTNVTIAKMRKGQYWVNFIMVSPSKFLINGLKNNENNNPDEANRYKL